MPTVTQEVSVAAWTPINMWAMLKALINNNCPVVTINGIQFPITNGITGTFAGQAGKGSLLIDYANGIIYLNTGNLSSPFWLPLSSTGLQSVIANITASPTLTQAAATQLTASLNRVSTAVVSGAGVALPPAVPGTIVYVDNRAANYIQVYGNYSTQDTINGITPPAGIPQGINSIFTYICFVSGNWEVQSSLANSIIQVPANLTLYPHNPDTYIITKVGSAVLTLPAPTVGLDDGVGLSVYSSTPYEHILSAIGLLQTGTPFVNYVAFGAYPGASVDLVAFQGKWIVLNFNGVTFQ